MVSVRQWLKWLLWNSVVLSLLCLVMVCLIELPENLLVDQAMEKAHLTRLAILSHNLMIMGLTLILFPILPILYGWQWLVLLFQLTIVWKLKGFLFLVEGLFPHALFELPTILTYQYLAFQLFKAFWLGRLRQTFQWQSFGRMIVLLVLTTAVAAYLEGIK